MSEYFTKWWCNRVKQDDEFIRVRFWENPHPPFPLSQVLEYGPLHMHPFDRAGPVSEISPYLEILL